MTWKRAAVVSMANAGGLVEAFSEPYPGRV